MSGPNDRILTAISSQELERRWAAAREAMRERGVEALVMQNNSDWLGGYVKWFTDIPATNAYPKTVVFHADEPMTMVEMGGFNTVRDLKGSDPVHRGVGELIGSPSFFAVNYTDDFHADCLIPVLKKRGYRSIGLVGPGSMPYAFVTRLKEGLSATRFVDMTNAIDRLKAIKGAEEIALIKRCCEMQDAIFAKIAAAIRPGMRDIDVTALAEYEGRLRGSEQGIFLGSSAPVGQPARFAPRHFQGRTLQKGDHLVLLIENNGPGAYYGEIARTLVLGKASNELIDGLEAMKEAQDHTLSLMKPGASCRDIANAHDDYMRQRGFEIEIRLYAHSQGYDMVERPMIRADEPMAIEENMNFAVHPGYNTATMWTTICDNYLVEAHGVSECLHKTEKKIFEIN
ncbi:MAG: aminopeptidase P family protein [Hyphomicrobiales bacterium]|nr:aminopeptidase P family protein [Hyphomicrobiales bacterium]